MELTATPPPLSQRNKKDIIEQVIFKQYMKLQNHLKRTKREQRRKIKWRNEIEERGDEREFF